MKESFVTFATLALVFSLLFSVHYAEAATAATVALNSVNSNTSQISVYGDPFGPVELHYGRYASSVANLGSTDQNGYLVQTISTPAYNIACGNTAYVLVNGQRSQTIPWAFPNEITCASNTTNNFSFSQNNVVLTVGQTLAVTLNGGGPFSITDNSSPVISADITGQTLNLHANAFGGTGITVCKTAQTNQCAVLYAVAVNGSQLQSSNQTLAPLSFSVSSNRANGQFLGAGNVLTFTFNALRAMSSVTIRVNGSLTAVTGSGTGPFTSMYTVTGSEPVPIPVLITAVDNASGNSTDTAFLLGNMPVVSSPVAQPVTQQNSQNSNVSVTPPPTSPVKFVFTRFLGINSTGDEVTELQKRLTALSLYSGPITGRFGALTEAAVKKFQKANNITQAGYVGPSTRAKLNQ